MEKVKFKLDEPEVMDVGKEIIYEAYKRHMAGTDKITSVIITKRTLRKKDPKRFTKEIEKKMPNDDGLVSYITEIRQLMDRKEYPKPTERRSAKRYVIYDVIGRLRRDSGETGPREMAEDLAKKVTTTQMLEQLRMSMPPEPVTGIETPEMSDQTKMMRFQAAQVDKLLMKLDKLNDTMCMILRCIRKE